ncbi:MAG: hypothetical protein A2137_02375, partial [Chloroflexi bacterium RBG_16_58_8]
TDTIFIGQFVGRLGIAGLSITFPLQMLTMGMGQMVGLGGASVISRLIGRGDNHRAERTLGNGITLGIFLSALLMLMVLPAVNFWLRVIGASEAVMPYARDYLTVMISGTVFNVLTFSFLGFVRAEGNARVAMTAMIIGSLLNIILDAVFIIALNMGVRGAALAYVISQAISLIYVLSYYLSGSSYLKIHRANFTPDFRIIKEIFIIGIASFVQTTAGSMSAVLIIRMAVTYGGDIAISAFGIIQRMMWFSLMPSMVLGQGMQPVLGFNFGAGRFHLVLKTIAIASLGSVMVGTVAFLILFFIPEPIVRIFTRDEQLIAKSAYVARLVFIVLPLFGFFTVGSMVFPSVGRAWETFIVAITRPLVFMIPLVVLLPRALWEDGVWLSFPVSDVLTFLLTVALLVPLIKTFRKASAGEKTTPAATPLKSPEAFRTR